MNDEQSLNEKNASRMLPRRKKRETANAPRTAPEPFRSIPAPQTSIRVIGFHTNDFVEQSLQSVDQLAQHLGKWTTIWIDITGLGSAETIRQLGELLGLHPLALEDAVNVHQRAKVDTFRDYLFIVARMIESPDNVSTEQISFFLKRGMLISFQERPGDCWDPVRQRLRQSRGKIRELGPAYYLLYALCSTPSSTAIFQPWMFSVIASTLWMKKSPAMPRPIKCTRSTRCEATCYLSDALSVPIVK